MLGAAGIPFLSEGGAADPPTASNSLIFTIPSSPSDWDLHIFAQKI